MEEIETTKTTKFLRCIVTEEQKRQLAGQMAESLQAISQLEANLKSVSTQLKAEISKHEASLLEASEKYRSGFEMKNVECKIEKFFRIGTVATYRMDTGECIEDRPMEGEELQRSLSLQEKEPVNEPIIT